MTNHVNEQFLPSFQIDISEAREFSSFYKRYTHALTNISEAKDISEAREAFYKAIQKRYK